MKKMPQITEAEYEVMKIIWHNYPISTNEITEHLLQTTNWNPRTIQTLIKRLTAKNIITYEKQGRVFVYTPLLKEEDYVSQQSKSFLDKRGLMRSSERFCVISVLISFWRWISPNDDSRDSIASCFRALG